MTSWHKVGRSTGRTPFKHFLLKAIVGQLVGVLGTQSSKVPCKANPFLAVDLCGGDGHEPTDGTHQASPIILHKQCEWLRNKRGLQSFLDIIEKDEYTFEQLEINCRDLTTGGWMRLLKGDAREYTLPLLKSDQAAFVHCDPNNVASMPLTGPFVESWNKYTTYLVTLGCNVGGLKRLSLEDRRQWFTYVELLVKHLSRHHDAVLFWLQHDASQWAYMLSLPKVWKARFVADAQRKAVEMWPHGVGAISYRDSRVDFGTQVARLFLTKEECREHGIN